MENQLMKVFLYKINKRLLKMALPYIIMDHGGRQERENRHDMEQIRYVTSWVGRISIW